MHERILIAEDDFDIANLIRIYLEKNKTSSDDFADYYGCIK